MMVTENDTGPEQGRDWNVMRKVCFEKIFFFFFECLHKALPDVFLLSLVHYITCYWVPDELHRVIKYLMRPIQLQFPLQLKVILVPAKTADLGWRRQLSQGQNLQWGLAVTRRLVGSRDQGDRGWVWGALKEHVFFHKVGCEEVKPDPSFCFELCKMQGDKCPSLGKLGRLT